MNEAQGTSGVTGAIGRAVLVALAVVMPVILLPQLSPDGGQALLLVALFLAVIVLAEYASAYPALIEFRFAAPFNRTRFALLSATVAALSLIQRGAVVSAPLPDLVQTLAASCGAMLDFPLSPVRLLLAALPAELSQTEAALIRDGAALAMVLALVTVAGFAAAIRLNLWPMGQGPFNVWINLPTFDPSAGQDVVARLDRQARVNIFLGMAMPLLIPGAMVASGVLVHDIDYSAPLTYVWGITAWAVGPAALVMRGLAMARVARMIRDSRRRIADGTGNAYAAV